MAIWPLLPLPFPQEGVPTWPDLAPGARAAPSSLHSPGLSGTTPPPRPSFPQAPVHPQCNKVVCSVGLLPLWGQERDRAAGGRCDRPVRPVQALATLLSRFPPFPKLHQHLRVGRRAKFDHQRGGVRGPWEEGAQGSGNAAV